MLFSSSPKKAVHQHQQQPKTGVNSEALKTPKIGQNSPEKRGTDRKDAEISPELVPIVTLLSAQTHRRYHEGTFMLYNDLNGDGKPADREWKEVYGILTGNQLAYWDAASLARFKNSPEQLLQTSSKPQYLNFTDAVFSAMAVLPAAKLQLENVVVVSTTLKNRYILQLRSYASLQEWTKALRLAIYEHSALQEAYTGALLSARGSRLSDIRTILAPKRFAHEDWVKIRYGSGMAWKRCYAVVEPSVIKRKRFVPGRVLLYDSDSLKKKALVGVITAASHVTAVYPQSPFFIDQSTIMKLEGKVDFKSPSSKKSKADVQETSLFLMPEQHSSVPGFDTLIRFLVPLYDAFGLYGRPQRLKADRVDPESLVFGLPTLPHVHYLTVDDLQGLVSNRGFLDWDARVWNENIKAVLRSKMAQGYEGCGSSRGFSGAVSSLSNPGSPRVGSASASSFTSQSQIPIKKQVQVQMQSQGQAQPRIVEKATFVPQQQHQQQHQQQPQIQKIAPLSREHLPESSLKPATPVKSSRNVNNLELRTTRSPESRNSVQLSDIYQKYSTIETPSDQFDNRNMILNGSAEEIDEDVLPSLMRKKSLMHGPYPTSEKHLIESEDSDEESEDEEQEDDSSSISSAASFVRGTEPATGLLAVPKSYDQRNPSLASVQSPLTQYNEFNQQFSKSVDQRGISKLQLSSSASENDDFGSDSESELSDGSLPPAAPSHGPYPVSPIAKAQQLPQIQQLQSLHSAKQYNTQPLTPSSGEKFDTAQLTTHPAKMRPEEISVQKSRAMRNLNQGLESKEEVPMNKPRFIKSPAASQNCSPRDFERSNGTFPQSNGDNKRIVSPSGTTTDPVVPPLSGYQIPNPPQAFYDAPSHLSPQLQMRPGQQRPVQTQQQHAQRKPPPTQQQQQYPGMQPQQRPSPQQEMFYSAKQHPQQHPQQQPRGPVPQQYYEQAQPKIASPNGQQQFQPGMRNGSGPQNYAKPQSRPLNGPPQMNGHPQQYPQQQQQGRLAPQQNMEMQRPVHPYGARVLSSEQKQVQGQQGHPMNRQAVPPRPQIQQQQQQQSASNIRSYGEQQYQYQVQPNFAPGQRPPQQQQQQQQYQQQQHPRPNDPRADPRAQNQAPGHGYMRQY